MSFNIVLINLVLRILIIKIVEKIGKQTESSEMKTVTLFVFMTQFINTGLLLPIANGNFRYQFADHSDKSSSFLTSVIQGDDPDFNMRWFTSVG